MNSNPIESTVTHKFYFLVIYLGALTIAISVLKLKKNLVLFGDYSLISTQSVYTKKTLHLSIVRSQLTYCSPIWRLQLIEDIALLERGGQLSTF